MGDAQVPHEREGEEGGPEAAGQVEDVEGGSEGIREELEEDAGQEVEAGGVHVEVEEALEKTMLEEFGVEELEVPVEAGGVEADAESAIGEPGECEDGGDEEPGGAKEPRPASEGHSSHYGNGGRGRSCGNPARQGWIWRALS